MVALGLQGFLLGLSGFAVRLETNNLLRTCFVLGGLAFAFSLPVWSASASKPAANVTRRVTTVSVDPETGRLVRIRQGASVRSATSNAATSKSIAKAKETAKQTPNVDKAQIHELIETTAKRHGVDPALVHSVVRVESNYQQKAISPKGAQGLMQLIPATASRFGVQNAFEPGQNLEGGVQYLKYLTSRFGGDLRLALAAYNAGEGAVDRHGDIPPYQETQQYVTKVTRELQSRGKPVPIPSVTLSPETTSVDNVGSEQLAANTPTRPVSPLRMYTDDEGRLHIETVSDE